MATPTDDASLKRLGGGRWQTRDERFTIEPQSGTWVIVDTEQTDELGLPLVRGPFPSLTAAKAAIADARGGEPPPSPLTAKAGALAARPGQAASDASTLPATKPPKGSPKPADASKRATASTPPEASKGAATADAPPPEPSWLGALAPDDRRRARRLLKHLADARVADAEGLVRRDLAGDVPALAAHAILAAIDALGDDATPNDVVRLLTDGRDDDLGVRWRIVDDRGRRISLER